MKKIIDGSELVGKKLEVQEDGTFKLIATKKFIPKGGEAYWCITEMGGMYSDTYYTWWDLNHSLLFRTEEECIEYKNFMISYYLFTREFVKGVHNYYFLLDFNDNLDIAYNDELRTLKRYFASMDLANDFRSDWGDTLIKQFLLDMWY